MACLLALSSNAAVFVPPSTAPDSSPSTNVTNRVPSCIAGQPSSRFHIYVVEPILHRIDPLSSNIEHRTSNIQRRASCSFSHSFGTHTFIATCTRFDSLFLALGVLSGSIHVFSSSYERRKFQSSSAWPGRADDGDKPPCPLCANLTSPFGFPSAGILLAYHCPQGRHL